MTDQTPVVARLRQLGLTRTEAEVYLAALQEAAGQPVSGYKVAQAMGRDPANLAKTLAALEKQGAVRVVQEKPRLFLPVAPDDFTRSLLGRMRSAGEDLVEQLNRLAAPRPEGLTLALRDNGQALDMASELLKGCATELLIFASRDVIDYLARDFGDLASRSGGRVRFLGVESSGIALAEETIITRPEVLAATGQRPWLHMIVDRRAWLTAQFNRPEDENRPCGWWSDDPAMAGLLAVAMDQACSGAAWPSALVQAPEPEAQPAEPQPQPAEPQPQLAVPPAVEGQAVPPTADEAQCVEPQAVDAPAVEPPARDDDDEVDDDGGFEFVVRHE